MAFTASNLFTSVFGNKRVVALSVACDAASGAVDTGLSVIDAVIPGVQSAATASPSVKANQNSAGTALNGSVFIKSAANGDVFTVLVVGR